MPAGKIRELVIYSIIMRIVDLECRIGFASGPDLGHLLQDLDEAERWLRELRPQCGLERASHPAFRVPTPVTGEASATRRQDRRSHPNPVLMELSREARREREDR